MDTSSNTTQGYRARTKGHKSGMRDARVTSAWADDSLLGVVRPRRLAPLRRINLSKAFMSARERRSESHVDACKADTFWATASAMN
jgi:hypothetical protein